MHSKKKHKQSLIISRMNTISAGKGRTIQKSMACKSSCVVSLFGCVGKLLRL